MFGTGYGEKWMNAAIESGKWCEAVMKGGRTFTTAWRKEEKRSAELRQKKRKAEEANKVPIVLSVTARQLRRFNAALIGPHKGPPKRLWLFLCLAEIPFTRSITL